MAGTVLEQSVGSKPVSLKAIGFVVGTVLILSSTAPAAKYAVRELPVGLLPLVRFGVAGLILAPFVLRWSSLRQMIREDGGRLLLAAAFCVPINQFFFLTGAKFAPAGHIGLIYAACPLVVLLLASGLGQERLTIERIIGVALSMVGVALIATENLGKAGAAGRDAVRGDLLEVAAVIGWGAYMTVNKPLVARHGALPVLAATFLLGALLDLPVALATLPSWPPLGQASSSAWLGLAYMATVISVGGLAFQNLSMRYFEASQVATFGNVSPLLTVVWGYFLFDERIAPIAIVGGTLVMVGILWASRPSRRTIPQVEATPLRRAEPVRVG